MSPRGENRIERERGEIGTVDSLMEGREGDIPIESDNVLFFSSITSGRSVDHTEKWTRMTRIEREKTSFMDIMTKRS